MNNIEDFIQWFQGFRDGLDPANITKEHLDIIERKINGLQPLYDIAFPTQEDNDDYSAPWDGYFPPVIWPTIRKDTWSPPYIWCEHPIGTPQYQPHVGTPLSHVN
ncbi:hypothetical protein D3C87_324180 [compost metagenome]